MIGRFEVGDHVSLGSAFVHVVCAKRLTPESPSGVSYRLLPQGTSEWVDEATLSPTTGYSDREKVRGEE